MSGVEQRAQELLDAHCPIDYNRALTGANVAIFKRAALDAIAAALASQPQAPAAAVPDGFVLVPREPTDDMLDKANGEKVGGHCYYCSQEYASYGDASRVWAAMLAAAPAPGVDRG
ncbi:hypothetical protein [Xanthomonas sp. LMG 12461]|uniref:hypothetical protein n=1 Tax=Xanthomonas sp. LMG 12461 TaxID=2014543 RepID=UPI0012658A9C|nr:hypothetical protein [Xanthomonas sp. LMG 12461]KAB7765363.1 hypothetical protein CEK68_11715 [Xanthomonas sp. LMG 12461]